MIICLSFAYCWVTESDALEVFKYLYLNQKLPPMSSYIDWGFSRSFNQMSIPNHFVESSPELCRRYVLTRTGQNIEKNWWSQFWLSVEALFWTECATRSMSHTTAFEHLMRDTAHKFALDCLQGLDQDSTTVPEESIHRSNLSCSLQNLPMSVSSMQCIPT